MMRMMSAVLTLALWAPAQQIETRDASPVDVTVQIAVVADQPVTSWSADVDGVPVTYAYAGGVTWMIVAGSWTPVSADAIAYDEAGDGDVESATVGMTRCWTVPAVVGSPLGPPGGWSIVWIPQSVTIVGVGETLSQALGDFAAQVDAMIASGAEPVAGPCS